MLKEKLSLRKEESHPSSKRLNELINSGRKYVEKRCLGFIDESTTPSSGKTTFVKPREEEISKKTNSKLKFQFTHCTKQGHKDNRCYVKMLENFQRNLIG